MKALFASAAFAFATAAAFPVSAGIVSIGNSPALDCWQATEAGDYDRNAFNSCNIALEQEGLTAEDEAATLNNRGVLYLRNRNYRAAGRDFDKAVETWDGHAEAWLNKAISQLRRGGGMETLPMIERAMELKTQRLALAYYSRSIAYERGGKLRNAYNDLITARDLAPGWKAPVEDLENYQVIRN